MSGTVTGLPVFRRGELARIKAGRVPRRDGGRLERVKGGGFVAVIVAEVGGRIILATTGDPNHWGRNLASAQGRPVRVVSLLWTVGLPIARRVRDMAADTLAGRRVGDAFDVPDHLATAAVEIAGRKLGLPTWDTAGLLQHIAEVHRREVKAMVADSRVPIYGSV